MEIVMGKTDLKAPVKRKGSSRVRRWMAGIASAIVLLIVLVVLCALTRLDAIVKAAIEKYGSAATQTTIRVESVKIRLRQGTGIIRGLTIGNPEGFESRNAFSLGEIGVGIDIGSIRKKVMVIDSIVVRAPQIFIEANDSRTINLNVLRKNLEKTAPPKPSEPAKKKKTGPEPRLILRRVFFTDGSISARVAAADGKEFRLRLPAIEMRNLGAPNGATPDQLARRILGELTQRALREFENKAAGVIVDKARDKAESAIRSGALERMLK
jgi:hypothetical protein